MTTSFLSLPSHFAFPASTIRLMSASRWQSQTLFGALNPFVTSRLTSGFAAIGAEPAAAAAPLAAAAAQPPSSVVVFIQMAAALVQVPTCPWPVAACLLPLASEALPSAWTLPARLPWWPLIWLHEACLHGIVGLPLHWESTLRWCPPGLRYVSMPCSVASLSDSVCMLMHDVDHAPQWQGIWANRAFQALVQTAPAQ